MKHQVMTQRGFNLWFSLRWVTIVLPAFLGILLSSCTSLLPNSHQSRTSKGEHSNPATLEIVTPADTTASPSTPSIPPAAARNNVKTSQNQDSHSLASQPTAAPDSKTVEAHKATASSDSPATETSPPIKIDETVCGAGGHEAFFATKVQEIYICKNETGALTYIATPKRKGNSLFLPAQKIQQGKLVGYVALNDSKTYIVTSGGFQLQEEGQPTKSEKVIHRKFAKN